MIRSPFAIVLGAAVLVVCIGVYAGVLLYPVNNTSRVAYRCQCRSRQLVDRFHTYHDCVDCKARRWFPSFGAVPSDETPTP